MDASVALIKRKSEPDTKAGLSDRVKKLKEAVILEPVRQSAERLKAILEVWRETEGQPAIIRSAKVFDRYLRGMTLYIDENPIVGSQTKYRKGAQAYPEWSSHTLLATDAMTSGGELKFEPEDAAVLKDAHGYFLTRSVKHHARKSFDHRHPDFNLDIVEMQSLLFLSHPNQQPIGGANPDYGKVLNKGLEGVIAEAREELAKLFPGYLADFKRIHFLEAVIISCEAVIAWAERYADLATEMATREKNRARKKELIEVAAICRRVPAKSARSFKEAVQSLWLIHAAISIEASQIGHSPGRFCQYMYPFYKASKERGEITYEEAIELIQLLFIKFSEIQRLQPPMIWKGVQQHVGQNLNVGGLNRDGTDATNELDFLVVDAATRVRLIQPSLSLLWHNQLSPEFLHACVELIKTGIGQPAIFSCDVAIHRLMDRYHVSIEDARDFTVVACVDTVLSHAQSNVWEGLFNMGKLLELALNNGRDPMTGKQVGLQTGEAKDFKCYEDVEKAFKAQLAYFMPLHREHNLTGLNYGIEIAPTPFCSALIDDCIKRGREVNDDGARFGLADGSTPVGMIDVANSLAAIRKVVFDDKRLTMQQVMEAITANFEGHENTYRLLNNAPKFGNDDPYVDTIAKSCYDWFYVEHQKTNSHLNTDIIRPYALSVTMHFLLGSVVGALPGGRKARTPYADGSISAYPGTDVNGPTALLQSVTKATDPIKWATHLLNMKFLPNGLATREGERKFLDLTKTYMDMGGYHIQFNVVNLDTLKTAQRHPEKYRDLVVRVAGFSAFFVDLTPEMQEEVIKRTEYTF